MVHIHKDDVAISLPTRSTLDREFGILFGAESQIISSSDWEILRENCLKLATITDLWENKMQGEKGQAYHPGIKNQAGSWVVRGSSFDEEDIHRDPQKYDRSIKANIYIQKIANVLNGSNLHGTIESIRGNSLEFDHFLVNTQLRGDHIESHEHAENAIVAVLGVSISDATPLILERFTGRKDSDDYRNFIGLLDEYELVPRNLIERHEVVIPEGGIFILRNDWRHSMEEVTGFRQTVGCFYNDVVRRKTKD